MSMRNLLVLSAVASVTFTVASYGGPCLPEIESMQTRIDAQLAAAADKGPTAKQSVAATLHHQPTPRSVAAAESRVGDVSQELVDATREGMERARETDSQGDKEACEQALTEVESTLKR